MNNPLPFVRIIMFSCLSGIFFMTSSCKPDTIELSNKKVKANFEIADGHLAQEFYGEGENGWNLIVSAAPNVDSEKLPLYNTEINAGARYLLSDIRVKSIDKGKKESAETVNIIGELNGAVINVTISLGEEDDHFHVEIESQFNEANASVEYILSDYLFHANVARPEFVHTSALKLEQEDIIGDRTFWSPALIMQQASNFVALVPDINIINENQVAIPGARPTDTGENFGIPIDSSKITFPTGFDLNTDIEVSGEKVALFSFGYIDALGTQHMHWYHPNDASMVRKLPTDGLKYGFDLFVSADEESFTGYQKISKYLWKKYGSEEFAKGKSLAMPLEDYAKVCYAASTSYLGSTMVDNNGVLSAGHTAPDGMPAYESWLEWKMNGVAVGGYRNNAPQWYDMIGNTSWWNNARDAVGMYRWGKISGDSVLVDRSRKVINLTLQAPQQEGAFPVIFRYNPKKWIGNHWSPPAEMDSALVERHFDDESEAFHTSSMSKTAAHLLRFYSLCENRQDIIPFVEKYADFLIKKMDSEGCIPSFINSDLSINHYLRKNGAGGVHIWFLANLYSITQKQKYLDAATKLGDYLEKNILPKQDWKDYEAYFSCTVKPLNFYDKVTGQGPRNTLSMFWALEGYLALYDATHNEEFLQNAELVADYLSLYQAVWQPHFIYTAYAFGGFGVQNTDAEWLDARQGEIAPAFVKLGMLTGRKDMIERGIAAAKASVVLINHERHIKNDIYGYPNFPLGLGPENIDHEGRPQSPMRTDAGWGEVSGLSGIADILYLTGDIYIDTQSKFAVGVNGISVDSLNIAENNISLNLKNTFSPLPFPYTDPISAEVKIASWESEELPEVSFKEGNNISIEKVSEADL